jgi:hypothetical protein
MAHSLDSELPTARSRQRRSQRLVLAIPIIVEGELAPDTPFSEQTQTVILNAHGALLQTATPLQAGQHVTLRNLFTNEKQESMVVSAKVDEESKSVVALEFTTPNPDFWHISFPPGDWSYLHPDAKKRR